MYILKRKTDISESVSLAYQKETDQKNDEKCREKET